MTVKQRYDGIQTVLKSAGDNACLFLCMLSIAEQVINHDIDFINAYFKCLRAGVIDTSFFCNDQEAILKILTGKEWMKQVTCRLPDPLPKNMYVVEKWYNGATTFTHFKRRSYDTLVGSKTVAQGKLIEFYAYLMLE